MLAKQLSISKIESRCDFVAGLLRALSHPQRLLILGHLCNGPKTVSELQALCEVSQSQLSQFLSRMRLEGLVSCKRNGRFQSYSVSDAQVVRLIRAIHAIYC